MDKNDWRESVALEPKFFPLLFFYNEEMAMTIKYRESADQNPKKRNFDLDAKISFIQIYFCISSNGETDLWD